MTGTDCCPPPLPEETLTRWNRDPALVAGIVAPGAAGVPGALLNLAPGALYEARAVAPLERGLSPPADRRPGGLVTRAPAAVPGGAAPVTLRGRSGLRRGTA